MHMKQVANAAKRQEKVLPHAIQLAAAIGVEGPFVLGDSTDVSLHTYDRIHEPH